MSPPQIPPLTLHPDEKVLISVEKLVVTVVDSEDGWLMFRQWEAVQPRPAGNVVLLGFAWEVTHEWILGSMGREPLRKLLNGRAVDQIHVVDPVLTAPDTRWHGFIIAEAATTFSNGSSSMESDVMATPEAAKRWVLKHLGKLLANEEQISQAIVVGPEGAAFDLDPSTWGSDEPRWIDVSVVDGPPFRS